jgi:hypothetical protein
MSKRLERNMSMVLEQWVVCSKDGGSCIVKDIFSRKLLHHRRYLVPSIIRDLKFLTHIKANTLINSDRHKTNGTTKEITNL